MNDAGREFTTEEMRSYTAACPLCGQPAYPTWERVDEDDKAPAAVWTFTTIECLTPGCPNSRY
ncbi:hypothetical protein KIH31_04675 [Paenarthrobacter sp. DKR-5]|uniref:hypothetical protein n=1 Tax=Paenarthrobacter sp. DKR-5 TaxID=2835535 RepID=UPI001BDC79FF|nr:hypothetical protein [Paenarthrobacter sp. DKR-5]MBT1001891.1 hypothetical protein [Paenarthrobacter sp. DKR-5]